MGLVTTDNQRLNWQAMNQPALCADSYKNVREATEEKIREAGPRADAVYGDDHLVETAVGRKSLHHLTLEGKGYGIILMFTFIRRKFKIKEIAVLFGEIQPGVQEWQMKDSIDFGNENDETYNNLL